MRNEFEAQRKQMRAAYKKQARKQTLYFLVYVIIAFLGLSYLIYKYGHIVVELYDSLIYFLNK